MENHTLNSNSSCSPQNNHCEIPECAGREPYPPVCVCGQNCAYGRMMLDNVGGRNSEMSAVSLYIYNHLILLDDCFSAEIFHRISIVEMHHLEIFAELAQLLGENPRLWTHKGCAMTYWSPSYNCYSQNINMLLKNAITGEQQAIDKYTHQCAVIKDDHIVKCLKRIIIDEHEILLLDKSPGYCGANFSARASFP